MFLILFLNSLRFEEITELSKLELISCFLINSNEADWKKIFSVNLMANLMLAKKLIPLMMNQSWGRVIHISSTVGEKGVSGITILGMITATITTTTTQFFRSTGQSSALAIVAACSSKFDCETARNT